MTDTAKDSPLTADQIDEIAGGFIDAVCEEHGVTHVHASHHEAVAALMPVARSSVSNLHPFYQQLLWEGWHTRKNCTGQDQEG